MLLPMRYNITHKVKKGETLIGLAKKYGTTVAISELRYMVILLHRNIVS